MNLTEFLFGITFAVFMASGVFFFKFWKASRDRFYLYFCIACWLLACERVAILFSDSVHSTGTPTTETVVWVYLIRLIAFLFILVAIINKNRAKK